MRALEELVKEAERTQIIMPVGGRGKRLGYGDLPKALIKIAGKTLIEREIELYRNCGFKDFKLLIGYQGEKIKEYLGDGGRLGVKIQYSKDPEMKNVGKGKAIKNAIENGTIEEDKRGIITFPDDIKLDKFLPIKLLAHHINGVEKYGIIATSLLITSTTYPYGVAEIDEYGRILKFEEKPMIRILTHLGVCVIEPEVYSITRREIHMDDPNPVEYESRILPILARENKLFSMIIYGDDKTMWLPINTRKELEKAEKILLNIKYQDES